MLFDVTINNNIQNLIIGLFCFHSYLRLLRLRCNEGSRKSICGWRAPIICGRRPPVYSNKMLGRFWLSSPPPTHTHTHLQWKLTMLGHILFLRFFSVKTYFVTYISQTLDLPLRCVLIYHITYTHHVVTSSCQFISNFSLWILLRSVDK